MFLLLACSALVAANPQVGAHRGVTQGDPENTLHAFNRAIEAGVDIIELDLRSTVDGEIVVMHDPTVEHTTNGSGRVAEMTAMQIKQLDAGSRAGTNFVGERVPAYSRAVIRAANAGPRFARWLKARSSTRSSHMPISPTSSSEWSMNIPPTGSTSCFRGTGVQQYLSSLSSLQRPYAYE